MGMDSLSLHVQLSVGKIVHVNVAQGNATNSKTHNVQLKIFFHVSHGGRDPHRA